jgi:hypothetical protein
MLSYLAKAAMAGLVPAIHVLDPQRRKDVDARHKAGHDKNEKSAASAKALLRDWQDTIAAARLCKRGQACQNGRPAGVVSCTPPIVLSPSRIPRG